MVSVKSPMPEEWERRGHERFDVEHPVLIGWEGMAPVPATILNISLGGAALRLSDRAKPWLRGLNQRDELWIDGLLPGPTNCRMVVLEGNVLRVHFSAPLRAANPSAVAVFEMRKERPRVQGASRDR